jgi:DNA-directed RNA polymerase subunit N (RpoN/RPB10)
MSSYKEYVIRCKTCNEEIACFAPHHEENLATGMSAQSSLDSLNIRNYCSRIAMMSPTTIFHNMQNDAVVNGEISVESAIYKLSKISFEIEEVYSDDEDGINPEIEQFKTKPFEIPTKVDVSTINSDPLFSNKQIPVGYDGVTEQFTEILSGRTYLAR